MSDIKRFIKYFSEYDARRNYGNLENAINRYAEENNLVIISVAPKGSYGYVVLFEEEGKRYE